MLPPYIIRLVSKTKEMCNHLLADSIKPQIHRKVKSKKEIRIFPEMEKFKNDIDKYRPVCYNDYV